MSVIGWIRDLFGIQKDMYETKKTRLEIDEIERKERERTLITLATLDDVKKYDPKIKEIERKNFKTWRMWRGDIRREIRKPQPTYWELAKELWIILLALIFFALSLINRFC